MSPELLEFCCKHILCDEVDIQTNTSFENFESELKSAGADPSSFPPHTVKFHVLAEFGPPRPPSHPHTSSLSLSLSVLPHSFTHSLRRHFALYAH